MKAIALDFLSICSSLFLAGFVFFLYIEKVYMFERQKFFYFYSDSTQHKNFTARRAFLFGTGIYCASHERFVLCQKRHRSWVHLVEASGEPFLQGISLQNQHKEEKVNKDCNQNFIFWHIM
jgi:hypothetical protein